MTTGEMIDDLHFAEVVAQEARDEIESLYRRKMEAPKPYKIKPIDEYVDECGPVDIATLHDNDRVKIDYNDGTIWWIRWGYAKSSMAMRLKTATILAVRRMP